MATEDLHPEYEAILQDYHRRQMVEHLTGPMLSLLVHCILVVVCAILMVGHEQQIDAGVDIFLKHPDDLNLDTPVPDDEKILQEDISDDFPFPKPSRPENTPPRAEKLTAPDNLAFAPPEMTVSLPAIFAPQPTGPVTFVPGDKTPSGIDESMKPYLPPAVAEATEASVLNALRWLKAHQEEDGSWCPRQYPAAMTGLALLAFLAHGETQLSEEFGMTVLKACQWLSNRMLAEDKYLERAYSHGIATYALADAYTLTRLPFLKPAMEQALRVIVRGQQEAGGFDYNYKQTGRWDLSVTAWQLQALKAGAVAGASVSGLKAAQEKGVAFLKEQSYRDGQFGYSAPGKGSDGMQGAGTLCLQLLGHGGAAEAETCVGKTLVRLVPNWEAGGKHAAYRWYYINQAMFHAGKREFDRWNKHFTPMLIKHQFADGHWENPGAAGKATVYEPYKSTALNALSLQVYHRILPSYKKQAKNTVGKVNFFEDEI